MPHKEGVCYEAIRRQDFNGYGRNSGIGLATVLAFANEGARLVITGRDQSTLDQAKAQLSDDSIAIRNDAGQIADPDALAQIKEQRRGAGLT